MKTTCKNCGHIFTYDYCNKCGQSAKVKRLQIGEILNDFNYNVLRVNKGVLYTLKELIIRPGYMLREYIEGKRVKHINPINFLLIPGVFLGFLHFIFPKELNIKSDFKSEYFHIEDIILWIYDNRGLALLFIIPCLALGLKLGLRKEKVNYSETFVILCFVLGVINFVSIGTYFINNSVIGTIGNIIKALWLFYAFWQFLENQKVKTRIQIFLTTMALELFIFLFFIILIGTIYFIAFVDLSQQSQLFVN